MPSAKGVARGANLHFLAAHEDLSLIGIVDSGDHVHQRGLAAAILAQYGQNLAIAHGQVDLVVGHNLAEALGEVLQLDGVRLIHPAFPHLKCR